MEEWRDIVGYEGLYEISNLGIVRSKDTIKTRMNMGKLRDHKIKGKPIKFDKHITNGRLRAILYKNGIPKKHSVHRLVLETFVGPCPEGYECCHKDDNHLNNKLDNLYWGTKEDNGNDKKRNGKTLKGSKNPISKLTEDEVIVIKKLLNGGTNRKIISSFFGVSNTMLTNIKNGYQWNHISIERG